MILLITYNVYGKLPTSRSGFYEKVFNALLFEHDSNKIGFDRQWHSGLGEKDFREMFTLFCIQTYSDEEYEFNRSYFLETLRYIRETVSLKKEFDPESFIFDCEHNLCLIIKDGQKTASAGRRRYKERLRQFRQSLRIINHIQIPLRINPPQQTGGSRD